MVDKFEEKGVSLSQSESALRQKYRLFSDPASLRSHWNCVKDRPVSQVLAQNSSRASYSNEPIFFPKLGALKKFHK